MMMSESDFSRQDIEFHRLTAPGYDDQTTRVYGIYHRYSLDPFLDSLANRGEGLHALDLGCGTGVVALAMAARGIYVTGIDHSPDMLRVARHKATVGGLGGQITFAEGDVTAIDCATASVDVIVGQGMLHHLDGMERCIAEIARVLRPEGRFYLSEPTVDLTPLGHLLATVAALVSRVRRHASSPDSVEAPIRTSELLRLLDLHGLDYTVEYMTHLPYAHRFMSDHLRIRLTKLLSKPWSTKQGDIVFIAGMKRGRPSVSAVSP